MKLLPSSPAPSLAITFLLTTVAVDAMARDALDTITVSEDEQLQKAAQDYNDMQADDSSRVVCTKELQSGGRFMKKVCRTVSARDADERQARNFTRSKQRLIIANERNPHNKR